METISKNDIKIGRLLVVTTAILWGLAGVCVKSISWGPMPLIAVRSFISLIMLLIYKRSFKVKITKWNLIAGAMSSATGILYVVAIKLTTAGTAIVLQYVAPILVFLYAVIFQHRRAKLSEILITLAVFGGIILSFADSLDATKIVGNMIALVSGVTFAGEIIALNHKGTDSGDALILGDIMSVLVATPFLFTDPTVTFEAHNLIWVAILAIFQYGLAHILFSIGIKRIDKIEASLLLTIEPIFNPIPVAIFCGEMMGGMAIVGSAIVILFVTLYGLLPTLEAKIRKRKASAGN